jgi:GMP synthase (glutamine-hydrolysing)
MKPVVILQHEPDDPPGSVRVALRRLRVPYEIRRLDHGEPLPDYPGEASAVIALGGAIHVTQTREFPFLEQEKQLMRRMIHQGAPVWGICLGAQILAEAAGGEVYRRKKPEVGWVSIEKVADDPFLHGISSPFFAFAWHEYSFRLPPTSHRVAENAGGLQVFRAGGRAWATQFHPEVDAAMAPHWLEDAVQNYKHLAPDFAERLRDETAERLPAYPAFCDRLVENFLLTSGLLPAD